MLKRVKSSFVLQDSSSSLIKKDSSIHSQESNNNNNIITFKLSEEGSFGTSPKIPSLFSHAESNFMKACGLCRKKFSPQKNIYIYRGDQSFCSDDCRCRKILIDELREEIYMDEMKETAMELQTKETVVSSSTRLVTNVGNGLPPRRNRVQVAG
ncbi:hypothetical protein MKW94_005062 [Papaver nudicaule]|uniref:FLZ-type domain-containing protein n=1 Tax=Papaver nudicaule TaxID=74823 RepID=A0AA41VDU8_PAPNU|nr:hypothetical protein [Papaver nudicaule]